MKILQNAGTITHTDKKMLNNHKLQIKIPRKMKIW